MKKLYILLFLLLSVVGGAQNSTRVADTHTFTVSGSSWTTANPGAGVQASFEELFTGTPATASVVIQGCMRGGTCTTLNTNTVVSNAIITPSFGGVVYDNLLITASWTGGTNPSVVVNSVITTASTGGGSGGGGSGNPTILATSYGVKADGRIVWDATITNTSQTVTCPNSDCNFSPADVGKIVFGTNAASGGYTGQITSTLILPQGTITSINNSNSIQVSIAATASSTAGAGLLIWGDDDTTALTNAWTATVNACATLQLPGVNPTLAGPAVMLIQSPEFNTPMAGSGTGSNATCSLGTGGNRRGLGLVGSGVNSTYIIPTPSFNFAGCTFGASAHACMFTTFDGVNLSGFNFWGAGISNPGNVTNDYVTEINSAAIAFTPTAGNSTINNVTFQGWGTNAAGTGFKACIRFDGGVVSTSFLSQDGCGQIGIEANNALVLNNITSFDNMVTNLYVVAGANVTSNGNYFCCTGQGGGGDALVAVFGTFHSNGDNYGATTPSATPLTASNALNIGYLSAASTSLNASGGVAYITNATMNVSAGSGNGQGIFVCGTQGGVCPGANTLYLSKSTVNVGNSRPPITVYGNYYDLGGNTFTGTPTIAASGKTFGPQTFVNCAAIGTAANPSAVACASAPSGSFSCATNASGGTCVISTSAVTANSQIFITQRSDTTTGTRLGVTCNTGLTTAIPEITAVTAGTSFTINLGTITTNPECFSYQIIN